MSERTPMVRSASDSRQVREARKDEKLTKDLAKKDLLDILSTDAGRRFIRRILDKTGMNADPFTTSSEIYYRVGQQSIGKWLQKEIVIVAPQAWLLMQQEAADLEIVRLEPGSSTEENED